MKMRQTATLLLRLWMVSVAMFGHIEAIERKVEHAVEGFDFEHSQHSGRKHNAEKAEAL